MPKYQNLTTVQNCLKSGQTTCVQLVDYYLTKIHETKRLNVYIEVYHQEAIERARALDAKFKTNPDSVGRLFGMVISIKDVLCYAGHHVTAASTILQGFVSPFTATAVQRLLDEDAIIIGRVNCDQFAMGSTNENSFYGPTHNGDNFNKIPGGSSGASAVSVQVDTCLLSLGSDTGGSVRQPAGFCGIIGLKPTYGRISRYGLLAYGSSFDQIGVLAHNIEDAALALEIMAGADEMDSTCSTKTVENYSKINKDIDKKRIAYLATAVENEGIHPEIKQKTLDFIEQLKAEGHSVEAVEFDLLDYIIPAYYVLTTAEASSNLSRYDGIRFGHRSASAENFQEVYTKSRTEGFSTEVKRRIMLGTFVLSSGFYDAYYTKAQKVRRLIQDRTNAIFENYDFIILPVSPIPAWNIGEKTDDPVAMYLADIFTVHANMVGIPAIALPLGKMSSGDNVGVQIMANKFEEGKLLAFAKSIN